MVFIFVPPTPPTAQAQELAEKIATLVRMCREEDPSIQSRDVGVAMRLARDQLRSGCSAAGPLQVGLLLLGAVVAGLVVFFNYSSSTPQIGIAVIATMILIIGAVALFLNRRPAL